ncbi:MAG: hypothetical protein HJJLKODD_02819 [Phycisphaerae bacterium]|nr:hypothetical protein [Phycisphaerae bacterium]
MELPYYPINDFGPVMKGLVIGGLGIFHVFLAQFAIGGGMLMCYFQWLAAERRHALARQFVSSYFQYLVLFSFVLGALTGVAMWFTTIQLSPRTIGLMVDQFHWIWATEWTFFVVEVVSGYAFYRYSAQLDDRSRMRLLQFYTVAAWGSLFWINGILSWQLTPGTWSIEQPQLWGGFFNASFWPSLLFRTVSSMATAALVACVVINTMPNASRDQRKELINKTANFMIPMVLMPLLGAWYLAVFPDDSRSWVLGGSPAMSLFMGITIGASLLIGCYALIGLFFQKLYINGATATLLCALAFGATAGAEFVREGVRKPYTIRNTLLSNSITPQEVAHLRQIGSVTNDPYPLRGAEQLPTEQLRLGARVYRFQCSICHTPSGVNGLTHLTGSWNGEQKRLMIAQLQMTKPFMPPFAGNAEELEALVQYLEWLSADRPPQWPTRHDPQILQQINEWLIEAGTATAVDKAAGRGPAE